MKKPITIMNRTEFENYITTVIDYIQLYANASDKPTTPKWYKIKYGSSMWNIAYWTYYGDSVNPNLTSYLEDIKDFALDVLRLYLNVRKKCDKPKADVINLIYKAMRLYPMNTEEMTKCVDNSIMIETS